MVVEGEDPGEGVFLEGEGFGFELRWEGGGEMISIDTGPSTEGREGRLTILRLSG